MLDQKMLNDFSTGSEFDILVQIINVENFTFDLFKIDISITV